MANRLANEASPYLRQHENNPVEWFPWGEEAFEKARREDKPVFLSIGYSTCHWCHVMANESFDDPDVATVLNEYFVSIKVDREERPDVDRLYMAFVQASTGSGGWPMSVWLTPEAHPFFGGTYFPPSDRHGRPGFVAVLERIVELWATERTQLVSQGNAVIHALREATRAVPDAGVPGAEALAGGADAFLRGFDAEHGGFSRAPKFPRPSVFNFLFRHAHATRPGEVDGILHAPLHTLRRMAAGGIHDQIGGGFHRYSVDAFWHVPHFEKMLYDQAQLASSFVDAWLITNDPSFSSAARDTIDYVLRDLRHGGGGFFSAEDADSLIAPGGSEHAEGAFYVWTRDEIASALTPEVAAVAMRHWGIEPNGNAPHGTDFHGELAGRNILIQRESVEMTAAALGMDVCSATSLLAEAKRVMFGVRAARPRPHRDEKIVTAWNGLMISACARAGAALDEPRYTAAAQSALAFLKLELFDEASGNLYRTWRDGRRSGIPGFAEDYAFLIQGLLDLYAADFDPEHLAFAVRLQAKQDALFLAEDGSGYFTGTADDPLVPVRTKEDYDGAESSASAVSALNLLRLARLLDDASYERRAHAIFAAFSKLLSTMPTAVPQMLSALQFSASTPRQLVIAGPIDADATVALLRVARSLYLPDLVVQLVDPPAGSNVKFSDAVSAMTLVDGMPAAYLCEHFACQTPIMDARTLRNRLTSAKLWI